jgi:hypothetical protein
MPDEEEPEGSAQEEQGEAAVHHVCQVGTAEVHALQRLCLSASELHGADCGMLIGHLTVQLAMVLLCVSELDVAHVMQGASLCMVLLLYFTVD